MRPLPPMAPRHDDWRVNESEREHRTPHLPPETLGAEATQRAYVLEDDPDIAALEADLLRDLGFTVVICSRIVELGDLMELALPHLLVVDVMLPDGDGGDITELLRGAWPGIPVVIVSAASRERLAELVELGPLVPKPFDLETFRAAVIGAVDAPRELRTAS